MSKLPTNPVFIRTNTTDMDPIVFANTYHESEELAKVLGWNVGYLDGAVHPFQIHQSDGRFIADFDNVLDMVEWLESAQKFAEIIL